MSQKFSGRRVARVSDPTQELGRRMVLATLEGIGRKRIMNTLFLGSPDSPIAALLREEGERVSVWVDRLDPEEVRRHRPEIVVSHGYRHILKADVLKAVEYRVVNLHIAYLPWNRGADPNLWSWIDRTPKGVTIHYVDEGIDTGDIIAQRQVEFGDAETLASSYATLQDELLKLFRDVWPSIRSGSCGRRPPEGRGSFHLVADRARVEHLLTDGWLTPVSELIGAA